MNAPVYNRAATAQCVQGEVREEPLITLQGATQGKLSITKSAGNEEQVEQFWRTGSNNHYQAWADQFFSEKEEYLYSMSSYTAGHFNPDHQLMGGWMNITSIASSIGSFSKWQSTPMNKNKKLYSFTDDYNDNVFDDCQCQDTFF